MQLVAYGAQDVYITGNAQITYFKVVYRRHTNFSIETIEQTIDSAGPGGKYTVQCTRNGDLATNSCLKVKLNAITKGELTGVDEIAWVRRLGHALIKQVKIEIGGSTIDAHVGVWLDLWHELTAKAEQDRGYDRMIGDVPELTELKDVSAAASSSTAVLPEYTLYIPFQFWFCRNTGLALPLIALQYHEVRFHVELENITKLLNWRGDTAPALNQYRFKATSIMIDYVYLDSEERRKFAQVGHEYLIEEVQHTGGVTVNGTASSSSSVNSRFTLNFNHPCKEIVWTLKVGAFSGEALANSFDGGNTFLGYTHDDAKWGKCADDVAKGLVEAMIFGADDAGVAGLAGADIDDTTIVGGNPAASVGLITVHAEILSGAAAAGQVLVHTGALLSNGTVDLKDDIQSATIKVRYTVDGGGATTINSVECTHVRHTLKMRDLSVPTSTWTTDNRSTHGVNNKNDVHVVQPHNYGLNLDGSGNPVVSGRLELNGHARFETQEGSYFNYYHPQAHTRTPADGVNVYCFGLHPENHQPSGTANLSRIDTVQLVLNFQDPTRPSGTVLLDFLQDSKLMIFALGYNVLRVMSGMAGKAYSN